MNNTQKLMVIATVIIGLVPGFLIYRFLTSHPQTLNWLINDKLNATTTGQNLITPNLAQKIYVSSPQKETSTLCPNSNYFSLVLILMKDGQFYLTKKCESKRDNPINWSGLASTTLATSLGIETTDQLGLELNSDNKSEYLIFIKKDKEIILNITNIQGLATSTILTLIDNPKRTNLNP